MRFKNIVEANNIMRTIGETVSVNIVRDGATKQLNIFTHRFI